MHFIKNKWIKFLLSHKVWGYLILAGLLIQVTGFLFFEFNAFFFLSGILFWSVLWWVCNFILRKTKQSPKIFWVSNAVFISLILAEAILRLSGLLANYSEKRHGYYESQYHYSNPEYWISRKTDEVVLNSSEYSYRRKLNSMGFSDTEWNQSKINNGYSILALGDSFTEGDGTHADSTWLKSLERKINDSAIHYMNAGICGSDPVFEYYLLKNRLSKFHPDLVIMCINNSDIIDIMVRGGFERFDNGEVVFNKGPWWEVIYASSHISRLFFRLFFRSDVLLTQKQYETERNKALNTLHNSLDQFVRYGRLKEFRLVFVFHPFINEVLYNKIIYLKTAIDWCEQKNYKTINLYNYYQKDRIKNNIRQYYWKHDGHPNAKGYELMAEGIYQGLNELEILPCDTLKQEKKN